MSLDYANQDRREVNPLYVTPALPLFDGLTYNAVFDESRLVGQWAKVYGCMKDGRWRTLAEIRAFIDGGSEAGISARLRDLRKEKWGSHTVERRRRGDSKRGIFEYRLEI